MNTINFRPIKFRFWCPMSNRMIYTGLTDDICNSSDWVIMEFTGLKDKNGKEIYEGDIIKYFSYEKPVIVRWTRENEDNHPGFHLKDVWGQYGNCEIIGNIFENKDLIK